MFECNEKAKYRIEILFDSIEDASCWKWDVGGVIRDHAEDWVDMYFTDNEHLDEVIDKIRKSEDVVEFWYVSNWKWNWNHKGDK